MLRETQRGETYLLATKDPRIVRATVGGILLSQERSSTAQEILVVDSQNIPGQITVQEWLQRGKPDTIADGKIVFEGPEVPQRHFPNYNLRYTGAFFVEDSSDLIFTTNPTEKRRIKTYDGIEEGLRLVEKDIEVVKRKNDALPIPRPYDYILAMRNGQITTNEGQVPIGLVIVENNKEEQIATHFAARPLQDKKMRDIYVTSNRKPTQKGKEWIASIYSPADLFMQPIVEALREIRRK